jgi:hypothetical protein
LDVPYEFVKSEQQRDTRLPFPAEGRALFASLLSWAIAFAFLAKT